MGTYQPPFISQGRGRPEKETDFPLDIKDFGSGVNLDNNPMVADSPTKYVANARSSVSGVLQRRSGSKTFGTDVWSSWNKLGNPATLPAGTGNKSAWSADGIYLAVAHETSPYVTIYKREGSTLTKLDNPATLPTGAGKDVAWGNNSAFLAVAHTTTPYVTIYERDGDTFIKQHNPDVLPLGDGISVAFGDFGPTNYSELLAVGSSAGANRIKIYAKSTAFSGDAEYRYITDRAPEILDQATSVNSCEFSADKKFLALGLEDATVPLRVYSRNLSATNGIDEVTIASLPSGAVKSVGFNSDSDILGVIQANSPYVTTYSVILDDITKLNDADTAPTGAATDLSWVSNSQIMVSHATTPFVTGYDVTSKGVFKSVGLGTAPAGNGNGISNPSDGSFLAVAHATTPYVSIYEKVLGTSNKVYMLGVLDRFGAADVLFRIVDGTTGVVLQKFNEATNDFQLVGAEIGDASDRRDWFSTSVNIGDAQYLYFTNGEENLQYTNGDTISEVEGVKGRYIATLENIMMLAHITVEHGINEAVYTKAGSNQFYADGDASYADSSHVISVDGEITQCVVFGSYFYIFTRDAGLWEVDSNSFIPRKISTEGTNSPKSVSVGYDIMVWVNKGDIYALPLGGSVKKISDNVEDIIKNSFKTLV